MTPDLYRYRRFRSRRQALGMLVAGLAASALLPQAGQAQQTHVVTAHNRSPDGVTMAFSPPVLRVAVGDSVTFQHADRGHDVNSYDDMRPAGAAAFRGRSGEEFSVQFDQPGTYGYFCRPHQMMGMVGFILVGDFTGNLADVRQAVEALRAPPLNRRATELLAQVDAIARDEGLV